MISREKKMYVQIQATSTRTKVLMKNITNRVHREPCSTGSEFRGGGSLALKLEICRTSLMNTDGFATED